jgi:hypothetical protein
MSIGINRGLTINIGGRAPGAYQWASSLFAAGEPGDAWINKKQFYFTDTAGTVPVTTTGDEVKAWKGAAKGTLAVQAGTGKFPLYAHSGGVDYLQPDGVNDGLQVSSINFTSTSKITLWASLRKLNDAAFRIFAELSPSVGANLDGFNFAAPNSAAANYGFFLNSGALSGYTATTFTAPVSNVISCQYDQSVTALADQIKPRVNGASPSLSATGTGAGTGAFGTYALNMFARNDGASAHFNGWGGAIIVRGAETSSETIAAVEDRLAGLFGVTL